MMKRFLPLLLAAVLACGCSTLSNINWDYGRLASAGAKAATAASISDEQVAELCRQSVAYTDAQTPLADAKYQQRLEKLMSGIGSVDGKTLNFKVYRSNEVNACAYGDGSVRVNSALMDLMDDDELFAVIGHELGHVVNKDSMKPRRRFRLPVLRRAGTRSLWHVPLTGEIERPLRRHAVLHAGQDVLLAPRQRQARRQDAQEGRPVHRQDHD